MRMRGVREGVSEDERCKGGCVRMRGVKEGVSEDERCEGGCEGG